MGQLRLVDSFKIQVSFAAYSLFYKVLLQKRPIILRSLLIVATPYSLQRAHAATHRSTLQHTAAHCSTLQRVYIQSSRRCSTLQHTATHCNTSKHRAAGIMNGSECMLNATCTQRAPDRGAEKARARESEREKKLESLCVHICLHTDQQALLIVANVCNILQHTPTQLHTEQQALLIAASACSMPVH